MGEIRSSNLWRATYQRRKSIRPSHYVYPSSKSRLPGNSLDQQPDGHEMIARLIDAERQGRAHRRTQLNLRLSKLRYAATLQDIDCSAARNLTSSQLAVLTDPAWMGRGRTCWSPGL